jgi:hypothetical protein
MNIKFNSYILLLLAGLLHPASRAFSQGDSVKVRKNIIEIYNCRANSLNGINPGTSEDYEARIWNLGFDYFRYIGEKNYGVEISAHTWQYGFRNIRPNEFLESGLQYSALTYCYSASFHFPLWKKCKINLYATSGITFRTGYEEIVVVHWRTTGGWSELITEGPSMRDVGIPLGFRFSWFPIGRIAISTDFRYTRFVYRSVTSSRHIDSYEGTTQNLIALQFKVGFCF